MKRIAVILAIASLIILCHPPAATASVPIVTNPNIPEPLSNSELVVSAVPFGPETSFIELYNQTDQALQLDGYSLRLIFVGIDETYEYTISLPSGYLLGKGYLALALEGTSEYFDGYYSLEAVDPLANLSEVYIVSPEGGEILQLDNLAPTAQKYTWLKRKSGSAGQGHSQDSFTQKESPATISGYGLYHRPESAPNVQIVEILARSSNCPPYDKSLVCGDYIKLHNSSSETVDLSNYTLRSDSGGSKSGNSFLLNYEMHPDSYLTINLRDDKTKLSLNDSGGYIWIEDAAGIAIYQSSVVQYPGVGTSRVGWSWLVDERGEWVWSSTPQPNAANLVTIPKPVEQPKPTDELTDCGAGRYRHPETNRCRSIVTSTSSSSALKPCAADQERNPETNRCRKIVSASSVGLQSCAPGQERNPATNRCRSAVLSSATLVPCGRGQERNPATNRCRRVAAARGSNLKPCSPGQERNPATNRCRKVAQASLVGSTVGQSDEANADLPQPVTWYSLVGAVVVVAVGYGLWEWRSELASMTGRLRNFITKN